METYALFPRENVPVDATLVVLQVVDRRATERPIQFVIMAGNSDGLFQINSNNGELTLAAQLDREAQTNHSLTVVAFDSGSNPISTESAQVTVSIIVGDVNDNPPVFGEDAYSVSIAENQPVGTSVLTILATDADAGSNADITYGLVDDGIPVFHLNPFSGELQTASVIDFESNQSFNLTLIASDGGLPSLSAMVSIEVIITDENDIRPVFTQIQYTIELSENIEVGTSVVQLTAIDEDTSSITYEISENNEAGDFRIDPTSGLVVTANTLDYETQSVYNLSITATDGLPNPLPSGTAEVVVLLTDVNDNPPIFSNDIYTVSLTENNMPNTLLLNASATDIDSGSNADIQYSIEMGRTDLFSIDSLTGEVYVLESLDREDGLLYELVLIASDGGSPQLTGTAQVQVTVEDLNDNTPQFLTPQINGSLLESQPTGNTIAIFTAFDRDDGPSGRITYSLQGGGQVFSINPTSGAVTLAQSLDYEVATAYSLAIVATDAGIPQRSALAMLFIEVIDVNDNTPVFSQEEYFVEVSEGLSVGNSILQIEASDLDSGTNADITFRLIGGNQEAIFFLDPQTALLSLASPLDFELQTSHLLTIVANNSLSRTPLVSTATVNVTVSEENEFIPVFTQSSYEAQVLENRPIGTSVLQIQAVDFDAGSSGELLYSFIGSGDEGDILDIDSDGEIRTLRQFNREQITTYNLIIQVSDRGTPSLSSRTNLTLVIRDENDSPPEFTLSFYTATLLESSPVGTLIVTTPPISASDADSSGPNSDLTYAIQSGNSDETFTVDPLTGAIQLDQDIDYEIENQYDLIIAAIDNGDVPLSGLATVRVDIEDVNDNRPLISGFDEQVTFIEGDNQIEIGPNITISDADTIPMDSVSIALRDGEPDDVISLIDPPLTSVITPHTIEVTGPVSAAEVTSVLRGLSFTNLDDEPNSDTRSVQITINDGSFSVSSEVSIVFQLINDNQPMIDLDTTAPGNIYSVVFTEGGPAVQIASSFVSIDDIDSEQTGIFSISAQLLNPNDGHLEGLQLLNPPPSGLTVTQDASGHVLNVSSETVASYSIFETVTSMVEYFNLADEPQLPPERVIAISANDGEFDSDPALSTVTITLINDPPQLRLGANVDHQVEFIEGSGPVRLTSSTNFALSDSDSIELVSASVTLINAPDGQNERLVLSGDAPSEITIRLTDHEVVANGSASIANYSNFLQLISYDNDLDSPSPELRQVQFIISDGIDETVATTSVTFNLVNDPPVVDLNGPQPGVNFTVNFEEGSPPIAAFSPSLTVSDVDSQLLNSAFVTLTSIDREEGLQIDTQSFPESLSYSLSANESEVSIIGSVPPNTYSTALQSISYYNSAEEPTEGSREIRVFVNDGESNSSLTVSIVVVNTVNDIPVLLINDGVTSSVEYVEESSQAVGVVTGEVSISDNDNSTLDSLVVVVEGMFDSSAEVLGYLDPSGDSSLSVNQELTTSMSAIYTFTFSSTSSSSENFRQLILSLTYQNTNSEPTAGVRTLKITISDGIAVSIPQSSLINVTLLNDNIPSFQRFIVQARVNENTAGILATTVMASDGDSSEGPFADQGKIIYSIESGNEDGFFDIDQESGEIILIQEKDREVSSTGAVLIVTAENLAPLDVPGTFPTTIVIVSVLDVNDNAPQFVGGPYHFETNEHSPVGTVVGIISAIDADIGTNSDIVFDIISGNQNSFFSIHPQSGIITVTNSNELDRETRATFNLVVSATDQGTPTLSNSTAVEITLLDINDNEPIFSDAPFVGEVLENSPVGTFTLMVAATDEDAELNGRISYSLVGSAFFVIDSMSGAIDTAMELDRETNSSFIFTIVATDGGSPSLRSTSEVTVQILDSNDNAPVFSEESYSFDVLEGTMVGQFVSVVMATDEDAGSNADLLYFINSTLGDVPFNISATTGTIVVSSVLDRESASFHQFNIIARDQGTPALETAVSITAFVRDINDNAPQFSQSNYEIEILENIPILSSVFRVMATDPDTGSNSEIVYSLTDTLSPFEINSTTGEVFTIGNIDRETQHVYQLEIIASDSGNPVLRTSATLLVNVTDVNDHSPVFSRPSYEFSIDENATVPALIGTVMASDGDSSQNAVISYSLLEEVPDFHIDSATGEIVTQVMLDHEERETYNLTVVATDSGSPSLSTTALVYITVLDSNDFTPQFLDSEYDIVIAENTTIDTVLVVLEAVDEDTGINGAIRYEIVSGGEGVFVLDSELGTLQLASSLDAETNTSFSLIIEARDLGVPVALSSHTEISIQVLDVNDNAPTIHLASSEIVYLEESAPVAIFGEITLNDADSTDLFMYGTVSLENPVISEDRIVILEQDLMGLSVQLNRNSSQVTIDGPANISSFESIFQSIQYHNINPEPGNRVLNAQLQVSDGVFVSTAQVLISVLPINDHRPIVFLDGRNLNLNNTLNFVENSMPVSITNEALVLDADSGPETLFSISVSLLSDVEGSEIITAVGRGVVSIFPPSGGLNLQLLGPAPRSDFEDTLSTLMYANHNENQQTTLRTVEVIASDGDLVSEPSYIIITVLPINDPPSLQLSSTTNFSTLYTEGDDPVRLSSSEFHLNDPDSSHLDQAEIQILNPIDPISEFLLLNRTTSPITITVLSSSTLILTGPATIDQFSSALQLVYYLNNASSPTVGARTVLFSISDGSLSAEAFTEVTVLAVNDPPELDLNGIEDGIDSRTEFIEEGPPVPIVRDSILISDSDSLTVHSASIQILLPLDSHHEVLTANLNATLISSNFDTTTATLTLSGTAPIAEYKTALMSVQYQNQADEPSGADRELEIIISDGQSSSDPAVVTITFVLINDAPVIILNEGSSVYSAVYIENGPGVPLVDRRSASISDVDSSNLTHLTVTIYNILDENQEVLHFMEDMNGLIVDRQVNHQILIYNFTFEFLMPVTVYANLLLSMTYVNEAVEPNATLNRIAEIETSDGDLNSNTATTTISLILVDDNQPRFSNE